MKDFLGRLWKVSKPGDNRGYRLLCYKKDASGNAKPLAELDADPVGQRHGSRARKGGLTCGGDIFGAGRFQVCAKCAADVSGRR